MALTKELRRPGPDPNIVIAGFRCRTATRDDIPAINEIASKLDFDVGVENTMLYYDTSPDTWNVIERTDDGTIVSFDSYNKISDQCYMGYQICVRKEYQGKGLTRMYNSMDKAAIPFLGNATHSSIERYYLAIFGPKIVGRTGIVTDPALFLNYTAAAVNCRIVPINGTNIDLVLDYDFGVIKLTRRAFLRKWLSGSEHQSSTTVRTPTTSLSPSSSPKPLVAVDTASGHVVGYGAMRLMCAEGRPYWYPDPLYADSDVIAGHLLSLLCAQTRPKDVIHVHALASCRLVLHFANRFGFVADDSETRVGGPDSWEVQEAVDWRRVYTMHEFWPA